MGIVMARLCQIYRLRPKVRKTYSAKHIETEMSVLSSHRKHSVEM